MKVLIAATQAVLVLVLFLAVPSVAFSQPAVPALTAEQWRADIRYMADELPKRHPNLFKWMKREDFDNSIKALSDKAATASGEEIMVGMMKVVSMAQDGHTTLFAPGIFQTKFYPVRFYAFSDGLFIVRASPENKNLVGSRVVKVGNLPVDEAMRQVKTVTFSDNDMARLDHAPMSMSVPEILRGLRIIPENMVLSLVVEQGGKQRTVDLKPSAAFGDFFHPPDSWADAASVKPLYRKDPGNNFWFEYLKDSRTMYVQQNAVANKDGGETVAAFYKRVFAEVEANPVEKFVLDLRFNGGGNNGLNRQPVIDIIKSKIDVRGKLFVITGRQTFSAAQNFVSELEKYTQAIFVGEPTAGHPNHYGDAVPFTLPNSKFEVRVSSVSWQDVDPRDRRVWTAPLIAADLSSEDYRLGRDPAMKAIAEFGPGQTFRETMMAAVPKGGAEIAKAYRAFRSDPSHKYVETEAEVNRLGYMLLQQKKNDDAIIVLGLNVEYFPGSANAYDSLGDAYQAAGRKDDAIKAYEKALSIDPSHPSARTNLQKLKGN